MLGLEVIVREAELTKLDKDFVINNARLVETYEETKDCEKVVNNVYEIKVIGENEIVRTELVALAQVSSIGITEIVIPENFRMTESAPELMKGFSPRMEIRLYPRLNCHDQKSDKLAEEMRDLIVHPPPNEPMEKEAILEHFHAFSENKEDKFLDEIIFKNLKNGFFVEAGAADFVFNSNSLHFEMSHDWSGLLVEVYPHMARYG